MNTPAPLYDLLILGAGAAGMLAAIAAAEYAQQRHRPLRIVILEKNPQPGIKVLVCGGGRCNFTNAGSVDFLIAQFGRNGRFLAPALRHLSNDDLRHLFASLGVPSHEEHDGKIYPDSNQARSVVDALARRMRELHIETYCGPGAAAKEVRRSPPTSSDPSLAPDPSFSVATHDARAFHARALLLAVGGMSYQRMGTTGDGYAFAAALGHAIVTPRPAIVGLLCKEDWPRALQGLAVRDVEVRIDVSGPLPRLATGKPTPSVNDLLFTHFGVSGPAVLNPSEIVAELLEKMPAVTLRINFARHLTHDQLGQTMRHWQQHHGKRLLRKMFSAAEITINATSPDATWANNPNNPDTPAPRHSDTTLPLPSRLAEAFLALESIPPNLPCAHLTSAHIHRLIERLKATRLTVHATRGFKEAMVTAGGVALSEVNPNTLESKLVPRLYLAGEILDLTGPSGGYNLQLAFSTGHLAGASAAEALLT